MDTSKEYILMCEKAREIQKAWDEKLVPSFFFDYALDRVTIRIWVPEALRKKITDPITSQRLIISIEENRPIDKWIPEGNKAPVIWLPRQDQLQGILPWALASLIHGMYWFVYNREGVKTEKDLYGFTSMEQLWLAFVMSEKFKKTWNGKEWIRINE
jgi:hypothetical protein